MHKKRKAITKLDVVTNYRWTKGQSLGDIDKHARDCDLVNYNNLLLQKERRNG